MLILQVFMHGKKQFFFFLNVKIEWYSALILDYFEYGIFWLQASTLQSINLLFPWTILEPVFASYLCANVLPEQSKRVIADYLHSLKT